MVKLNSILTIEGRGNRVMDVKEIIKQAAEQENKAYKFYTNALKLVKDAASKVWIKELAEEELKHKEMLENFDASKIKKFKPEKIQDLHITEYLVDKDITEVKDFQDVLIVAMKKEQKSYNFYVSMAKSADNADIKKLCKILAQEELKHKHKLELYYDDIVFRED
ncbi:MAG: ferritin family protein [Candidatus Jettenia sp. CY-1]|nr:ferritin family protein [Candidatus Jettenia sp.]WKZ20324.1 MAG: ferritin family protein [Candidatus Jettenia sp. CY-1]